MLRQTLVNPGKPIHWRFNLDPKNSQHRLKGPSTENPRNGMSIGFGGARLQDSKEPSSLVNLMPSKPLQLTETKLCISLSDNVHHRDSPHNLQFTWTLLGVVGSLAQDTWPNTKRKETRPGRINRNQQQKPNTPAAILPVGAGWCVPWTRHSRPKIIRTCSARESKC